MPAPLRAFVTRLRRARCSSALVVVSVRAATAVALHRTSLDGWLRAVTPSHPVDPSREVPDDVVDGILVAEAIVRRFARSNGTCLYRSLGRFAALRQAGVDVTIVFGVRDGTGVRTGLVGHAWLERDGVPILEREPPHYTVTHRHPSLRTERPATTMPSKAACASYT